MLIIFSLPFFLSFGSICEARYLPYRSSWWFRKTAYISPPCQGKRLKTENKQFHKWSTRLKMMIGMVSSSWISTSLINSLSLLPLLSSWGFFCRASPPTVVNVSVYQPATPVLPLGFSSCGSFQSLVARQPSTLAFTQEYLFAYLFSFHLSGGTETMLRWFIPPVMPYPLII